jgi:hypothetical protein
MSSVHGLPIRPLPEGYVVVDAMVLLKVLNADGEPRWVEQWTPGLNNMERLGMLTSAVRTCEKTLLDSTGHLGC